MLSQLSFQFSSDVVVTAALSSLQYFMKHTRTMSNKTLPSPLRHSCHCWTLMLLAFCTSAFCNSSYTRPLPNTPSTPVSCWSDSRPSSRTQLEASSRSSEQRMDRPAPQGQQWHPTSWRVEKIRHAWSYRSDARVLDDYAWTTTTSYWMMSVKFHRHLKEPW